MEIKKRRLRDRVAEDDALLSLTKQQNPYSSYKINQEINITQAELQQEKTVQYLLNVRDEISWKIPAVVVKDAKNPAFLQIIFRYDFDHVTFLEVKK